MLSIFLVSVDNLDVFFEKMSISSFGHFKNRLFGFLLLSCSNFLYILDINPFSDM